MRALLLCSVLLVLGCQNAQHYLQSKDVALATPLVESSSIFASPENKLKAPYLDRKTTLKVTHLETGKELQQMILSTPGTYEVKAVQAPFLSSSPVPVEVLPYGKPIAALSWITSKKPSYFKGGSSVLTDGKHAAIEFQDKGWTGADTPFKLALELDQETQVDSIVLGVLLNASAWIYPLARVTITTEAANGERQPYDTTIDLPYRANAVEHRFISLPLGVQTQRFELEFTPKALPKAHPGAGQSAWLFLDELIIY
jgi:hypothetical protein